MHWCVPRRALQRALSAKMSAPSEIFRAKDARCVHSWSVPPPSHRPRQGLCRPLHDVSACARFTALRWGTCPGRAGSPRGARRLPHRILRAWRGLGCHPRLFLGCRVDSDGWDGRVGGLGHVSRGRPAAAATVSAPLLPAISPTSPPASPSPAVVWRCHVVGRLFRPPYARMLCIL